VCGCVGVRAGQETSVEKLPRALHDLPLTVRIYDMG
jgi:hypothetical protein